MNAREKTLFYGPKVLSNRELIALVIGSGCAGKDAETLAGDILAYGQGLEDLGTAEVRELSDVYGIGSAKACSIVAAFELGKRMAAAAAQQKPRLDAAQQVAAMLIPEMAGVKQEHFFVFCLNSRLRVISKHTVSIGTVDSAPVHPRDVFAPAIRQKASAVIVAHGHPSGDPTPSPEDISLTETLQKAGEIIGIKLLDHVIVAGECYTSLKQEGFVD